VPGFVFCRQVLIGYDTAENHRRGDRGGPRVLPRAAAGGRSGPPAASASTGSATAATPGPRLQRARRHQRARSVPRTVDAKALSLPVLTLVLAGMDAFNPCAFFVLLFLLSLLVHAAAAPAWRSWAAPSCCSRPRVLRVHAAWLNVFLIAGELRVITVIAGLVALGVAALNIKDYFWFKAGPSLSIPDAAKPGLFKRMRDIVNTGNLGPMLASTVLLAIVANSYELLCTAGFPMVYTRVLTLAKLETWQYYAWLAAYKRHLRDSAARDRDRVRTHMGARKLSESEGRILKLVSGFMMLGFGLLLLLAPQMLTNRWPRSWCCSCGGRGALSGEARAAAGDLTSRRAALTASLPAGRGSAV